MSTHEVKLGIGDVSGMFYHAPAGTALPASANAPLAAAWKEVGDVSQDGISFSKDMSTENLRNWANVIKRVFVTEHTESVQAPIISTTVESLKTVLGEDNVAESGNMITASLSSAELPPEEAFLFRMKDDDDMIVIACKKGQVTAIEGISFAPGSPITWTPTITALEEGWQLILTTYNGASS